MEEWATSAKVVDEAVRVAKITVKRKKLLYLSTNKIYRVLHSYFDSQLA